MSLESVFSIVNIIVLLGWIFLFAFYPKKWIYDVGIFKTKELIQAPFVQ